jgi:hypothetical protein
MGIIEKLIERMGNEYSDETIGNSCQTLCQIIEAQIQMQYFLSESSINKIFDIIKSDVKK